MMAASLLAIVVPSSANDSSGFLGTTGVVELTKTDAISMVSERLEIGMDQVRVDYVFRNVTDKPVATVLAFPMPDIDLPIGPTAANYLLPARSDNFLGFKVTADGKPITTALERARSSRETRSPPAWQPRTCSKSLRGICRKTCRRTFRSRRERWTN
jgi:hypothetical protein